MTEVICPYCGQPAQLTDSAEVYGGRSYGNIWLCRPCGARVGTHKRDGKTPLGTLADAPLRALRMRVHGDFDPLWKQDPEPRGARLRWYRRLAEAMGIELKDCHMAMFDEELCRRALEAIEIIRPG